MVLRSLVLYKTEKVSLTLAQTAEEGGQSFCLGLDLNRRIFVVGWGYDVDLPFSVLPAWTPWIKTKGGNETRSISWFGFFLTEGRDAR